MVKNLFVFNLKKMSHQLMAAAVFFLLANLILNYFFYSLESRDLFSFIFFQLSPLMVALLFSPLAQEIKKAFAFAANPCEFKSSFFGLIKVSLLGFFTLILWWLARFHLLPFSPSGLFILAFLILCLQFAYLKFFLKRSLYNESSKSFALGLFKSEIIFFFFFHFWAIQASFHSDIFWGEKLMDMSMLTNLLRQEWPPLIDPWASGLSTHYYYWGHFQLAALGKLSSLKANFLFMSSISLVAALTGQMLFAFFNYFMAKRYAALGAFCLCVMGNMKALIFFLKGHWVLDSGQFWGLTRVFDFGAFSEYPSWSFIFADLHAHMMNYPQLVLFLFLNFLYFKNANQKKLAWPICLGLSWGLLLITSSWDAIYTIGLWGLLFLHSFLKRPGHYKDQLKMVSMPLIGLLFVLSFLFDMQGATPFRWGYFESLRYSWISFFYLLGGLWAILLFVLFFQLTNLKKNRLLNFEQQWWMINLLYSMGILLAMNLLYMMDPINTVFKFGNISFILQGILAMVGIFELSQRLSKKVLSAPLVLILLLTLSGMSSASALLIRAPSAIKRPSLNGSAYLQFTDPEDFAIIQYINKHISGHAYMISMYGNSFEHDKTLVASFSGLSTYLGWSGHVQIRGVAFDEIYRRQTQIDWVYSSSDVLKIYEWLHQNNISYLLFSRAERQRYGDGPLDKFITFKDLFSTEFCYGKSCLIKIN